MRRLIRSFTNSVLRAAPFGLANRLKAAMQGSVRGTREELLRVSLSTVLEKDDNRDDVQCPVCGSVVGPAAERIRREVGMFKVGPIIRVRCPECDAVFGPVSIISMRAERLQSEYELLYSVYAEPDTTRFQRTTFQALEPRKASRILNYACGTWKRGVNELLADGFDVYGYEPSLPKQHPRIATSLEELGKVKFDGIFSHNFVEHIQNPVAQFSEWKSMLCPGGRMAHSTACFEYLCDESPFHICYLLGNSLNRLCGRVGLKVTERRSLHRGEKGEYMEIALLAIAE
jgi:Methyltransferase domain